ncbi:MAG: NUDIX hydrolase [Chloroflexi bacterium]|nr:NUDIX hydrolase [Chloroflexota bacterium]
MINAFLFWLWRVLPFPGFIREGIIWFLNPKYLVAVDALIVNDDNACLLFNHPYRQKYTWGLPGGYLKRGEHPENAIKREVFEESGLDIHVIRLIDVDMKESHPRITLVYSEEIVGELKFTPSPEVSEISYFPIDQLPGLFPNQRALIHKHCYQVDATTTKAPHGAPLL